MTRGDDAPARGSQRRVARRRAARSPAPKLRHAADSASDTDHEAAPAPPTLTRGRVGKPNGTISPAAANGGVGKRVRRGLGMPAWRQAVYLGAVIASTAAVAYIGTVYVRDKETGRPNYIVAHVPFFFILMGACAPARYRTPFPPQPGCCTVAPAPPRVTTASYTPAPRRATPSDCTALEAVLGSGYFTEGGKYHTPDTISSIAAGSYQTMWGVLVLKQLG